MRSTRLVLSGYPLGNMGVGVGVYTYRLIVGLLRMAPSLDLQILLPAHFSLPPEIPESIVRRIGGPKHLPPVPAAIYWSNRILSIARGLPGETVFHSPGPIAGFGRAPRTVVTIHDCLYRTFPQYYGRSGIRKLNILAAERYAARADLVLTQSEFSAGELAEKTAIPVEKIRVLYPWVDEGFFSAPHQSEDEFRTRLSLPKHYWLYIGGYDYRKNVDFLVDSYAEARRQRSLPQLILAGGLPSRKHPTVSDVRGAIERAGLRSDQVRMIGFVPVENLPALYRSAGLVVYPSLMEGFGYPAAEAMAVGTPILASNASSLPEVVRNPSCLFDPRDRTDLCGKLIAAADDESQFKAALPPTFRESYGIQSYLQALDLADSI